MYILDKISCPHMPPLKYGWYRASMWHQNSMFYVIRVDVTDGMVVNLRHLKWAKELKVVTLFTMWASNPAKTITMEGQVMSQNCWFYNEVTKVISQKRVVVNGRRGYPNAVTRALPILPRVYETFKTSEEPPHMVKYNSSKYHDYIDDHPNVSTDDEEY